MEGKTKEDICGLIERTGLIVTQRECGTPGKPQYVIQARDSNIFVRITTWNGTIDPGLSSWMSPRDALVLSAALQVAVYLAMGGPMPEVKT